MSSNSRDQCVSKLQGHLKGATATIQGKIMCTYSTRNWGASYELRTHYLVISQRNWGTQKEIKRIRGFGFLEWANASFIKY